MTYGVLFQLALAEWIEDGGEVSRMTMLVDAYRKSDLSARYDAFIEWLDTLETALSCSKCLGPVRPSSMKDKEDDVILCKECKAT